MSDLQVAVPQHLLTAGDIREFVDRELQQAASAGGYPVWRFSSSPTDAPEVQDRRQLLLILLLALPGRVELAGPDPGQAMVDLHVRAQALVPGLARYWQQQEPGSARVWMDDRWPAADVLRAWPRTASDRWGPGPMVIANLGQGPVRVPDGSILLASRSYRGVPDPTSDNDALPAGTAIWLSPK